jgi:hypothetical protein
MNEDEKWTFWDALTNANPDWWDCNNPDPEDEDEQEEEDDEDD